MYPQAVYFPIRTLFLTLKIEQREKHKATEQANLANKMQNYVSQLLFVCTYYVFEKFENLCSFFIAFLDYKYLKKKF